MTAPEVGNLEGLTFPSSSYYLILEEIGRGGMGITFLAERNAEGVVDYVVLKTVRSLNPEHEAMLKEEANIATTLRHENIVKTYGLEAVPFSSLPEAFQKEIESLSFDKARRRHSGEFQRAGAPGSPPPPRHGAPVLRAPGQAAGRGLPRSAPADGMKLYLLVMDYVEGTDLRALFLDGMDQKTLLPPLLAGFIISRVARALSYAHEHIVHRDISPENVLINLQGVTKLSDFGIAVRGHDQIRQFAGKLTYMAPEQLEEQDLDGRADLYALGLVAYQVLTGISLHWTPPGLEFEAQCDHIRALLRADIVPPHEVRPDIPEVLSEIVLKMLAPKAADRQADAERVVYELEQKYLYAEGFGPTNNSLAAYLSIFYSGFKEFSQDELRQLRFLADDKGQVRLRRPIRREDYSPIGISLAQARPASALAKELTQE